MNPPRNNDGQNSNHNGNHVPQYNTHFSNTAQPYLQNSINQDEDQYLLEDSVDQVPSSEFPSNTPFKIHPEPPSNTHLYNDAPFQYQTYANPQTIHPPNNYQNSINTSNQHNSFVNQPQNNQVFFDFNNRFSNQQFSQVFAQQQNRIQNTNALSRASKLDQSLMLILRQTQKQPENVIGSKVPSKIQEKSKKAVSRLSHQFFAKSGNPQENIKSKKKSRKTVAAFGLDYKKDCLPPNNEEASRDSEKNIFLRPSSTQSQPQKMQIQSVGSYIENQKMMGNSPQKKQKDSQNLVHAQNRISEVKRKRQRLSSGIQGLTNLLKTLGSEKKEKKISPQPKSQPELKQNNRVTMDMNSLLSFLQSNEDQKDKASDLTDKDSYPREEIKQFKQISNQAPQISDNIRHLAEYIKPSINVSENVILEDQDEDEVTPMKSSLRQKSNTHQQSVQRFGSIPPNQARTSLQDFFLESQKKIITNPSKDHYTRQIFNKYFCNLNERIHQKKQLYEQLIRKKAQIVRQINNKLSQFTVNAEKLAEWKEEEHKIRQKIYYINQKVSKQQFDKNSQVIHKFQLTFGIQLHRLQKTQLDDGFYIQFTYDDTLFRLHRNNKTNEIKCKFLERLVLKKTKKYFEFSFEQKADFIQAFTNKKMKQFKKLTQFMIQLIRYIKALQKMELTMAHYAYIYCVKDFRLAETNTDIQFIFTSGSKLEFLFSVDLMDLLENGNVKISRISDGKNIEIPQEYLKFGNGNKIGKCFIFLEKYVSQLVIKEVENAVKTK